MAYFVISTDTSVVVEFREDRKIVGVVDIEDIPTGSTVVQCEDSSKYKCAFDECVATGLSFNNTVSKSFFKV